MAVRIYAIDFLRGIAILMMAVFHFLFDLNYLGFLKIELYSGFWGIFQIATLSLFLFLVGVGITISSNARKEKFAAHIIKRALLLSAVALLISAVTYILFPSSWIYFGIIHMIAVSLLISIPFSGKRLSALVAGIAVILTPLIFNLQNIGVNALVWLGFSRPWQSFDFAPIFPYFGLVLIGIFIGNVLVEHLKSLDRFEIVKNRVIIFLGRNSLAIYILHQPIIFGALFVLKSFI